MSGIVSVLLPLCYHYCLMDYTQVVIRKLEPKCVIRMNFVSFFHNIIFLDNWYSQTNLKEHYIEYFLRKFKKLFFTDLYLFV